MPRAFCGPGIPMRKLTVGATSIARTPATASCLRMPGPDGRTGTADDGNLINAFNLAPEYLNLPVVNRTINGIPQIDPNWPTSAPGQTLGIHSIDGSAGGAWLGVTFHQQSWGANGESVLNLNTNTWSLLTGADGYWAGHTSIGNGKYVNGGGSSNGLDSRGAVIRDPDNLMNSSKRLFIMQPPTTVGWFDGEHSSWFNASTNPNAPILFSRYNIILPPTVLPWIGEIIVAATDGSNTVWRFAHNHNGGLAGFYGESFAQISNDGRWALFSSYWDGTLGASADFGISTRVDTFIVELSPRSGTLPSPPTNLRVQ